MIQVARPERPPMWGARIALIIGVLLFGLGLGTLLRLGVDGARPPEPELRMTWPAKGVMPGVECRRDPPYTMCEGVTWTQQ